MTDPFTSDPIIAAWNLLLHPWQDYHAAGVGTPAERAAIGPLRQAALDLAAACDRKETT